MHRQDLPMADYTARVFGWYQFSREANAEGLRKAYSRWPMDGTKRKRHARPKTRIS